MQLIRRKLFDVEQVDVRSNILQLLLAVTKDLVELLYALITKSLCDRIDKGVEREREAWLYELQLLIVFDGYQSVSEEHGHQALPL